MTTPDTSSSTSVDVHPDISNLAVSAAHNDDASPDPVKAQTPPQIPLGSKVTLLDTEEVRALKLKSRDGVVQSFSSNSSNKYSIQVDDKTIDLSPESLTSSTAVHSSPSVQYLFKGAKVSIVRTDNVESRYPERIGQVGVIYDVPIHPNTWYKVQFNDGKILTFRPSALMSVNDKGEVFDSPHINNMKRTTGILLGNSNSAPADILPSQSTIPPTIVNGTSSNTNLPQVKKMIPVGTMVRILDTPTSRHRNPEYIGCLGEIVNIPVHPNTWYHIKIKNSNNVIIKIQATNMDIIHDPNNANDVPPFTYASVAASSMDNSSNNNNNNGNCQTNDSIKGKIAKIKSGKFKNKKGIILRTGNGWVQIQLFFTEIIIAKRGYEIDLILDLTEEDIKNNDQEMIGEVVEYSSNEIKQNGIVTDIKDKLYIIQNPDTKEIVSLPYGSFVLNSPDFLNELNNNNNNNNNQNSSNSTPKQKRRNSLECDVTVKRNRSNSYPLPYSNNDENNNNSCNNNNIDLKKEAIYSETINYINNYNLMNKGKVAINWDRNFYNHTINYPSMKLICKYCNRQIAKGNKYCWNSRCIASPAYRGNVNNNNNNILQIGKNNNTSMNLNNDESDVCNILMTLKENRIKKKPHFRAMSESYVTGYNYNNNNNNNNSILKGINLSNILPLSQPPPPPPPPSILLSSSSSTTPLLPFNTPKIITGDSSISSSSTTKPFSGFGNGSMFGNQALRISSAIYSPSNPLTNKKEGITTNSPQLTTNVDSSHT